MDITTLLKQRIAITKFDPTQSLTEAEIRELVACAIEAPSSYNLQHWRFVAVTKPDDKQRLIQVANGQIKVTESSVTFIVLGDLQAIEKLPDIWNRLVQTGAVDQNFADSRIEAARRFYAKNDQLLRDEAIRSASLAAMILMLAAQARGWVSGPMIGFDPEGVKREFGISDRYVPVMLLSVGYAAPGNLSRKPRLTVDEVLAFDRSREF
jgi:nitroreductase